MRNVDLRSDTCSQPDAEMRQVIANAAVGNDSWGEDPSVNELLALACEVTGKEAAIFCCTGTMANLVAAMTYSHAAPYGGEVIMGEFVHTYWYEVGGVSNIARLSVRTVDCSTEYMPLDLVAAAIRPINGHMPKSVLLWMENTYMLDGGTAIPIDKMRALYELARSHDIYVHLDGARLFNAAVALGVEVSEIAACADSVQFCLSKGLGAPFGSVLCGSKDFIDRVKRCRQAVGGGLRQAGIMASAGTLGIKRAKRSITADHRRARILAEGLNQIYAGSIDLNKTQSNIVLFDAAAAGRTPQKFRDMLWEKGIKVLVVPTKGGEKCRLMTYPGINDDDVDYVLKTVSEFAKS